MFPGKLILGTRPSRPLRARGPRSQWTPLRAGFAWRWSSRVSWS